MARKNDLPQRTGIVPEVWTATELRVILTL